MLTESSKKNFLKTLICNKLANKNKTILLS